MQIMRSSAHRQGAQDRPGGRDGDMPVLRCYLRDARSSEMVMRLSESKPVFRKIFAASSALIIAAVAFVTLANLASTGGKAQTYSFRTNSETFDIYSMKDGSIDIDYEFN